MMALGPLFLDSRLLDFLGICSPGALDSRPLGWLLVCCSSVGVVVTLAVGPKFVQFAWANSFILNVVCL